MRSLTGFIIIIGFLCAAMGALIWSYFTSFSHEKYIVSDSYIAEPDYLNLEQNDAFFPVSKEKLPENIKSLTKNTYEAVCSESKQDFEMSDHLAQKDVFYYDRDKHLLKRSVHRDNKLHSEWIFKYNADGRRITDETTFSNDIYNYDDKGNMAGWSHYHRGNLVSSAILKYDDKNNPVEESRQNALSKVREEYLYQYNSKGQKTSASCRHSGDNRYNKKYVYMYDDKGRLLEWIEQYERGAVDGREVSSYDSNGSLIEKISYIYGSYLLHKTVYHYDNKGNKIEELMFNKSDPDSPFYKRSYNYNTENKLIEQLGYSIWIDPISKKERISSVSERSVFEYEFYPK